MNVDVGVWTLVLEVVLVASVAAAFRTTFETRRRRYRQRLEDIMQDVLDAEARRDLPADEADELVEMILFSMSHARNITPFQVAATLLIGPESSGEYRDCSQAGAMFFDRLTREWVRLLVKASPSAMALQALVAVPALIQAVRERARPATEIERLGERVGRLFIRRDHLLPI